MICESSSRCLSWHHARPLCQHTCHLCRVAVAYILSQAGLLSGDKREPALNSSKAGVIAADLAKNVRLLEVSKAKNSPFGLLSSLTLAGLLQTASQMVSGDKVSMQSLGAALLAQKLQQTAFRNGITQNGTVMAIMPEVQVRSRQLNHVK